MGTIQFQIMEYDTHWFVVTLVLIGAIIIARFIIYFKTRCARNKNARQSEAQEVMDSWNNSNYNNLPLRRDSNDQFLRSNRSRQMLHPTNCLCQRCQPMSHPQRWMSAGGSSQPNAPAIYVLPPQSTMPNTFSQVFPRTPEVSLESQEAPPYKDNQLPRYEDLFPSTTENVHQGVNHI